MNSRKYHANCKGCASLDEFNGKPDCLNGIFWHGGTVPKDAPCYTPVLYRHPDGEGMISFDSEACLLVIENELSGRASFITIGKQGLLTLGHALIGQAMKEFQ